MVPSVKKSSPNLDKYQPAYIGAKFDKLGYCLKHPMVRLCKPAAIGESESRSLLSNTEEGEKLNPQFKYVIIRKICSMCGEHSLRNERKYNKSSWAHGYQQPGLIERHSCKGYVAAHSTKRGVAYRRSSMTSSATESPPSSPETNEDKSSPNAVHGTLIRSELSGRRTKNLEDLVSVTGKKMPRPPVRDSCRMRDCDLLVDNYTSTPDISTRRKRLEGKVPYGNPTTSTRREKSLVESPLRKDDLHIRAGSLSVRSLERLSHGRSFNSTCQSSTKEDHISSVPSLLDKSSTIEKQRSSSRHSRPPEQQASSRKSVAPCRTNASFSRRHSTEAPCSKSMCSKTFSRHGSAPELCSNIKSINLGEDTDLCNRKGALTAMKRNNSKLSLNSMTEATASMTSGEGNGGARVQSGRSFLSLSQRERIKPNLKQRSKHAEEKSIYSRGRSSSKHTSSDSQIEEIQFFSRGRSRSKARSITSTGEQTGTTAILLARQSFSNSLTRRRSLSRNASRVLKITSTMDGDNDAEHFMEHYRVPQVQRA